MTFTVMSGKCMDIADLSFKGVNLSFLSKPGLMGQNAFDTHGPEALRSIMGGFLFTCGMENIGAPCVDDGIEYPMHGRLRSTPAEHIGADAFWDGDDYRIALQAEVREAELFGENLVLRRRIETTAGQHSILIRDEITNESFRTETMMLLYHFNIGYPFLSEACRLILPSIKVTPRDKVSANHMNDWQMMDPPRENEPEYVYGHELATDQQSNSFAAVWNQQLGIGLKISFNTINLPWFFEWKSVASGDYALGLEPSNSSVLGRLEHQKRGNLHRIAPFATERFEIKISLFDQQSELENLENEAKELVNSYRKGFAI